MLPTRLCSTGFFLFSKIQHHPYPNQQSPPVCPSEPIRHCGNDLLRNEPNFLYIRDRDCSHCVLIESDLYPLSLSQLVYDPSRLALAHTRRSIVCSSLNSSDKMCKSFSQTMFKIRPISSYSTTSIISMVAPRCNGFGIILNGALVGLLLSVYKEHHFLNGLIQLSTALFIGFSFNILRIIGIILVAPPFLSTMISFTNSSEPFTIEVLFSSLGICSKGPLTKVREKNGDQAVAS